MLVIVALSCALLAAAGEASGTVDKDGAAWQVADAIAFPCETDSTCVALMSVPYDRETFYADGRVDLLDIYEHTPLDRRQLLLEIDASLSLARVSHDVDGTTVSSTEDDLLASFVPRTSTHADGIAGAVFYGGDEGNAISVEFDLPIDRGDDDD